MGSQIEEIETDCSENESTPLNTKEATPALGNGTRKRKRKSTTKAQHGEISTERFLAAMKNKRMTVKCNQTNKKFKVDASVLSRENGEPLTEADLVVGGQLLMDYNKKSWPVSVMKIEESNENKKKCKGTTHEEVDDSILQAKAIFETVSDIVEVESQPSTSVDLFSTTAGLNPFPVVNGKSGALAGSTPLGTRFRKTEPTNADLMKVMKEILSAIRELTDKKETRLDDPNYIFDDVNLMHIPAKDMCAYGRSLLDVLFSKEEQARSVLVRTPKSAKPPLSPRRVQLLFECVEK